MRDLCDAGKKWGRRLFVSLGLLASAAVSAGDGAQEHLDRAQSLYGEGKLKGAVIELKNALQQNPSMAPARRLLGRIYLQARDGSAAEKEFRRALALGGDDADLRLDLAEAYLMQGQFSQAIEQVQRDLQGDGKAKVRALTLQGRAQVGLKELDKARESLEQAVQIDPDAYQARLALAQLATVAGEPEQAMAYIDDLLARDPGNMGALLMRAELDRKAGRLDKAKAGFDEVLRHSPDDVRVLLGRATVLITQKKFDEGNADLDRVDKIKPGLVMTEYLRGLAAFQNKQMDQAYDHLQKVLAVAPANLPSQLMMGVISYNRGDLAIADEYLGKVVAEMPTNLSVVKILASARIKLKAGKQAIEVLEPALKAAPQDAQLLALAGSAYMLSGEHSKGAELMQRAVEIEPNLAGLRTQLALGLLAEGDTDAALTQLQDAVELDQGVMQADVLLVLAHLKKKQYDEALKAAKALEQRMADSPVPYNLTGLAYLAKGDKEKAAESFSKALQVDPSFLTAEANLARIDLSNNDLDAAQRRFESMLKKDDTNLGAYLGLVGIAEKRKDTAAMVDWLQKAREKVPTALKPGLLLAGYHLRTGKSLKALAVANEMASNFPNEPAALEMLGRAQMASGQVSSAVASFQRVVQLKPAPTTYLLLGAAQVDNKDYPSARKSMQKALEIAPDFLRAKVALGLVELEAGYPEAASSIAREIQLLHPDRAVGFELEARAQLAKKAPQKAVKAYEKAYERKKTSPVALALSRLYRDLDRPKDAMHVLEDWLKAEPNDLNARMQLAMLYQVQGRRQEAVREYEILQKARPDNAVLLNNLAWSYFELGDKRALELSAKAYEKSPQNPEILDTHGWILLRMGDDPQRALTLLQQALVAYPTHQEIGFHVAYALHELGRDDEARRALAHVLKAGSNFNGAADAKALAKELGL